MKLKLIIVSIIGSIFLLLSNKLFSQKTTSVLPILADSLASGNSKDLFKSFFQLALNRVTGNNKEIQFSSNPFAIMARMDSSLLESKNYINYTGLRNLNFSFSVKLDTAYKFNGFSSGVKYAIINNRDETVSDQFLRLALDTGKVFFKLNEALLQYISKFPNDREKQKKLTDQSNNFFAGKTEFSKLDRELKDVIRQRARELNADTLELLNSNMGKHINRKYEDLRTRFHQRSLWTVGISDTTYKDQFFFSNVVLSTEYLKGLDDPTKPLRIVGVEFNSRAAYNFIDNFSKAGRDLQRQSLQIEPGFNLVFRTRKTLYSLAEFKISGSYYRIFSGLQTNEKRDSLTLNGTLRLRIINDIWLPLEIKYDPKSGNVFGFLNVRANFNGFKDLFGNKK